MKELNEFVKMLAGNEIMSITPGKRNWAIRVSTSKHTGRRRVVHAGTFGALARWGDLIVRFNDPDERDIRIYMYTYKRDYENALKVLQTMGIF